jgi:hypothetical protein
LGSLNVTVNSDGTAIVIKGIDLASQGLTKTVYINQLSGGNRVCILDKGSVDISQVTTGCTGTDEISLECNGVANSNGYTCTVVGSQYKIEGLVHSAVTQYTYASPPAPLGGGNGGGGIATTTSSPPVCHESWQCGLWSDCSAAGTQTQSCSDLNSCGTTLNKPAETQSCTPAPASVTLTPAPSPGPAAEATSPGTGITGAITAGDAATYAGIIVVIIIIGAAIYWKFRKPGRKKPTDFAPKKK